MFQFQNLHIGYTQGKKKNLLFQTKELTLQKGDFVALIGPNGSGKTTLFNTILGLQPSLSGNLLFNNQKIQTLDRIEKVKAFSFVPSKFFGVNHLTVYDLIAMGRTPYTNILNQLSEEDKQIIHQIIEQLNLTHLAQANTLSLSDGERQIAMIGKALAQESEIMILDEPTAFLDYNNRRKVLQHLQEIADKNQKIIILSTHDLELSFEYCSKIIAINKMQKELVKFETPFNKEKIISEIFEL